ncbi:MAG: DinB family protein [Geothrix sp.]|uniref:DinB family protein n=1 Tax=Geothrix sp. TaxID=1962974 RepID=UPI0017A7BAE9|nr:DinB family protein [Geothrix sp.]NWJ40046.1 DinB family protein [Geothrix sp.]WIL21945.1 MAG: DinB family protein [Geothrix sp.]
MTPADLLDLFRYDAWANARLASAILQLPPEAAAQDLGGSFPTLRTTFAHIVSAEWLWLERWRGSHPTAAPGWVASADLAQLVGQLKEVEAERDAFLAGLSEADLGATCAFTLLSGKAASHALRDLLVHAANHSTYHRGQLAAMLRRLGSPAPATDFLVYRAEVPPSAGGPG